MYTILCRSDAHTVLHWLAFVSMRFYAFGPICAHQTLQFAFCELTDSVNVRIHLIIEYTIAFACKQNKRIMILL